MGVIKKELAHFVLSDCGSECEIELNESGRVDIHIDNIQLVLTEEEFEEFAEIIVDARKSVNEIKNI